MEFHQLRYFLAVARTSSFVRAAEEEGITQPSLSQQIRKLEQDLGLPLFDRLGRSVRLTKYGEALLPEAEAILTRTHSARRSLESLQAEHCGSLSVGVIPTILPYALVEPLADFRRLYPKVRLDIRELTTEKLIHLLRTAELDLAILALPVRHSEIVCSELFKERLFAALPPRHPLAGKESVSLAELRGERMLLLREGHCLRDDVLTACSRANTPFLNVFESDHLASILSMVANGFGISLVPQLAARQNHGCSVVPIAPQSVRRVGYAQAAGHCALPLQKNFIRFLKRRKWIPDAEIA